MGTQRRNLEVLQVGRGLAATAVVGFHANVVFASPKYFGVEPASVFRSGDSGVYFFFVLSGLVMMLAHQTDFGKDGAVGRFLVKRVRRIYPPLWIMLAVMLFLLAAFPSLSAMGWPGTLDILNAFVAGPTDPVRSEPLVTVEWTLRHEMLFYAMFAVALWKPKLGRPLLIIWLAVCAFAPFAGLRYPLSFIFDPVHLLFGLGSAVGLITIERPVVRFDQLFSIGGIFIFAGFWMACVNSAALHDSPFAAWGYGIGGACAILGLISMENRGVIGVAKPLRALGDASYSIYLVHFLVVSAAAKTAKILAPHIHLPAIIWWALICTAGVAAGFGFYYAVERPLLKLRSRTSV